MKKLIFVVLGAQLLVAGAAYAESRAQFCSRWDSQCQSLCPASSQLSTAQHAVFIFPWRCAPTCKDRKQACLQAGCYHFTGNPGPKCQDGGVRTVFEPPIIPSNATAAVPSFLWPVRGLVTSGFGAQNEGINVAVPEGTPIKATDDGVVAYAGNELKGYGNLVLIRHANDYVSAYGNASQLLVTRGDSIKRGQVIAHAGQTGNVTSPQLHFEIRKGSTPVDPLPFLGKAN